MKEREELIEWLKAEQKYVYDWYMRPDVLQFCIQSGKLDYCSFFQNVAWADDVVEFYADYLKDNNILKAIGYTGSKKKLIEAMLDRNMLNNILCLSIAPSLWTDELSSSFAEKFAIVDVDLSLFKSASFLFKDNPLILKGAIEAKRFDLINGFENYSKAWTDENKLLLTDVVIGMVESGEDDNISNKILERPEVFVSLLRKGIYRYASLLNYSLVSVIKNNEEYLEVMINAAVDIVKSGNANNVFVYKFVDIPKIYIELIRNGIYDYVLRINSMTKRNEIYESSENIDILIDAFDKIEDDDGKRALYNSQLLFQSNKFLKKVLNSNDIGIVKDYLWGFTEQTWFDEDIKFYVDNYLDSMNVVKYIANSSYGLSLVLSKDNYDKYYILFGKDAWSKDNIYKCIDNSLMRGERHLFINIKDPYYLYLKSNFFSVKKEELKVISTDNHTFNEDTIKDNNLLYSFGEKVVNNEISFGSKVDSFLKLIYETKSEKIIYMMRYLINDDLSNIGKLFDENGMTEYLFNHLIFDSDYRDYCLKNGKNFFSKCNNKVYLQYLSFVSKYPEVAKNVIISVENVDEYFDENGVKLKLLDKLFRPSCIDLLVKLNDEIEYPKLSDKKRLVLDKMKKIDNDKIKKIFFQCVSARLDKIDERSINDIYNIVRRIVYSNSSEIRAFGDVFTGLVLERDNPEKELLEIEKIFIQDKIPFVGKIYQVFKKLYPNYKGIGTNDRMSPTLKSISFEERDRVIFNDLLRIELGSNNRNLQQYLVSFFNANMFYELVRDGKIDEDSFSNDEIRKMYVYLDRVNYLCKNFLNIDIDLNDELSVWNKLGIVEKRLSELDSRFTNVPDYIVKNLCMGSGFDSLMDMIAYSVYKPQMMDNMHRSSITDKFKLEKGDYVKGIRSLTYLPNILQNGSVAAEFLGDSSNSDLTPLDTDLSLVTKDGSISEALNGTIASNYGPIYLVLKGNNSDRYDVTRNSNSEYSQQDRSRIELFETGALGKGHYGIRTGFASSEIDYIIASSDFEKIGFEIALNGFYIPVVDKAGDLRFTVEDYENLRRQMSGLSHYGVYQYELSNNLVDDDILEICRDLRNSENNATVKRNAIYEAVSEVLAKYDITLKTKLDDNFTHGTMEFFDTGSTGRGTNVANDSDFDFIVRVDRNLFFDEKKMNAIRNDLLEKFGKDSIGDFRLKDVYLEGVDDPLKIDMTFVVKTNKLDYATESCIKDRLDTIKTLYPEQYDLVVANIIYAKKFFKAAGCYKPKHVSENPQGGLGGIGTENWILQHGGSFYDAAVDFISVADVYPTLKYFQQNYRIQDFGKNHLAEKRGLYPYDNFCMNLNDTGFEKMKSALKKYVSEANKTNVVGNVHKC